MKKAIFILLSTFILLCAFSCNPFGGGAKPATQPPVAQTSRNVSVEINAPRLDVMSAAIMTFVDSGFPIIHTDEKLGIITTDFTKLKTGFGGELAQRFFGIEDFEIMLTVYVRTKGDVSLITILPKGRIKQKTKFGIEYEDLGISGKVYERLDALAKAIKIEAEKNK